MSFKLTFVLGPGIRGSIREPFKSGFSIPLSPVVPLAVKPCGFPRPGALGAHPSDAVAKGWVSDVAHRPLAPQGPALY